GTLEKLLQRFGLFGTTLRHDIEREIAVSCSRNRNPTISKDAERSVAGFALACAAGGRLDREVRAECRAQENDLSTEAPHRLKPQAARVRDPGSQGRDAFRQGTRGFRGQVCREDRHEAGPLAFLLPAIPSGPAVLICVLPTRGGGHPLPDHQPQSFPSRSWPFRLIAARSVASLMVLRTKRTEPSPKPTRKPCRNGLRRLGNGWSGS